MKTIEVTFAFNIGDEVVPALAWKLAMRTAEQYVRTHEYKKGGYKPKPAINVPVFRVLERIAQECPGGVQRHYVCRGFTASKYGDGIDSMTSEMKFLEHELTLWPEPENEGEEKTK